MSLSHAEATFPDVSDLQEVLPTLENPLPIRSLSLALAVDLVPEDVVCEILLTIATNPRVDLKTRAVTVRSSSQVCRTWRASALRCREIWAYIIDYEDDPLPWMQELLERSSPFPLTITDNSGNHLFWTVARLRNASDSRTLLRETLLLKHKARWRQLSAYGLPEKAYHPTMRLVPDYLLRPAPKLRVLKLRRFISYGNSYYLPGTLFAGHAPSLRRLDLGDINLEFDALHSIGGQLEELCLQWSSNHISRQSLLFVMEWLRFLRSTPRLRYLFLHDLSIGDDLSSGIMEDIFIQGFPNITLNKLQVICLEMPCPTACKAIMDVLTIPEKCGFLLYCKSGISGLALTGQSAVLELIQQRVNLWDENTLDRAMYARMIGVERYFTFSNFELGPMPALNPERTFRGFFDRIVGGDIHTPDPHIAFRIELPRDDSERNLRVFLSLLSEFRISFPMTTHLQFIVARSTSPTPDEVMMLVLALSDFKNVKTLEVPIDYFNSLFEVLRRLNSDSILLPKLQLIRFLYKDTAKALFGEEELDLIRYFLLWRSDQGRRIPTVDMRNSIAKDAVDSEAYQDLSNTVEIVGWT